MPSKYKSAVHRERSAGYSDFHTCKINEAVLFLFHLLFYLPSLTAFVRSARNEKSTISILDK